MADNIHEMDSAVPAKRCKLDYNVEINLDNCENNLNGISKTSELVSGNYSNGGDFAITTDSGFNELTPPRSMDEDSTNAIAGPSQPMNGTGHRNFDRATKPEWPGGSVDLKGGAEANEDDDDDRQSVTSNSSNLSRLSDLSASSSKGMKDSNGSMSWVQQKMLQGISPRTVLQQMLGVQVDIADGTSDSILWKVIVEAMSELPKREKLRHINTIEDVVRLFKTCKKIVVLTGAGVSVSCGIPDFRSRDGIYSRLAVDFPDLPDPQSMFDIHYFRKDPRPFFKFAKEIYPGQFTPSLCHKFIRKIEQHNKLLRNYTQNIDTLEQVAGIQNVVQCHGSFATATCQKCTFRVTADEIKEDIFAQNIPLCRRCVPDGTPYQLLETPFSKSTSTSSSSHKEGTPNNSPNSQSDSLDNDDNDLFTDEHLESFTHCLLGPPMPPPILRPVMKPDIVFFGEGLSEEFHEKMSEDKLECDLLIVIGSSLKVRPVALIPNSINPKVPQILINREPLKHLKFDVELLGDCDIIINELCRRLGDGWNDMHSGNVLNEISELPPRQDQDQNTQVPPHMAPHPRDESDIEALKACWAPKITESMAERLPPNSFLMSGTHRYIFEGAEVFFDPDDEIEDDAYEDSSSESDCDGPKDEDEHKFIGPRPEVVENGSATLQSVSDLDSQDDDTKSTPIQDDEWASLGALSTPTNGTHAEDWTSLNASLDASSLDCSPRNTTNTDIEPNLVHSFENVSDRMTDNVPEKKITEKQTTTTPKAPSQVQQYQTTTSTSNNLEKKQLVSTL